MPLPLTRLVLILVLKSILCIASYMYMYTLYLTCTHPLNYIYVAKYRTDAAAVMHVEVE